MWNPFKRKPKLKVGDLVLGYKYKKEDILKGDPQQALGTIISIKFSEQKFIYVVEWELGQGEYPEEIVLDSRKRFLLHYGKES